MAARTWIFNILMEMQADGTNDFSAHDYKAALMDTAYTPDIDAHEEWGDVSANECAEVTGYTSGGQELQNISITRYDATDKTVITWDSVRWDLTDGLDDVKGVMVYNDTVAGKPLVAFYETASAIDVPTTSSYIAQPAVHFVNGGG